MLIQGVQKLNFTYKNTVQKLNDLVTETALILHGHDIEKAKSKNTS